MHYCKSLFLLVIIFEHIIKYKYTLAIAFPPPEAGGTAPYYYIYATKSFKE